MPLSGPSDGKFPRTASARRQQRLVFSRFPEAPCEARLCPTGHCVTAGWQLFLLMDKPTSAAGRGLDGWDAAVPWACAALPGSG